MPQSAQIARKFLPACIVMLLALAALLPAYYYVTEILPYTSWVGFGKRASFNAEQWRNAFNGETDEARALQLSQCVRGRQVRALQRYYLNAPQRAGGLSRQDESVVRDVLGAPDAPAEPSRMDRADHCISYRLGACRGQAWDTDLLSVCFDQGAKLVGHELIFRRNKKPE